LEFRAATGRLTPRDRKLAARLGVDLPPTWGGIRVDLDGSVCARVRLLNRRGEPRGGHMEPMAG
jgi:hypothetical protein